MSDINLPARVPRRRARRPLISTLTFILALPVLFAFFIVLGLWRQTERYWRRTGTALSLMAASLLACQSILDFSL